MIDWWSVVANSFWVLGAAIILASISYYYWLSQQTQQRFSRVFGTWSFQRFLFWGLLLVGIGLLGTSRDYLQAIPAVMLIAGCIIALFVFQRARSLP